METIILNNIDKENDKRLKKAAEILKASGTVVFPTETVYGLGANALDEEAIKKIYIAKGRPSDNPLIVHISNLDQLEDLVEEVTVDAKKVIDKFWPGPITIILKKNSSVLDVVTGGLNTVAVRMPANKIAYKIIELANLPIAAPSANLSGKPSPTVAEHVITDLDGRVEMIVCGGKTVHGLESTVLDLSSNPPLILRPGSVTIEDLKTVLENVELDPGLNKEVKENVKPKSPGMKYTHYSPEAEVVLFEGKSTKVALAIKEMVKEIGRSKKIGIMATEEMVNEYFALANNIITLGKRDNPAEIGAELFKALRDFDDLGVEIILVEGIESTGVGEAVMNRLRKASSIVRRVED